MGRTHGDLGIMDDKEMSAWFPNQIKGASAEWQSSKHRPVGKARLANSDVSVWGKLPDGPDTIGGVVGGKYDKGDYSGMKAFSKPATQRRGVAMGSGNRLRVSRDSSGPAGGYYGTIAPQYDKGDYSGMKAFRGKRAKATGTRGPYSGGQVRIDK